MVASRKGERVQQANPPPSPITRIVVALVVVGVVVFFFLRAPNVPPPEAVPSADVADAGSVSALPPRCVPHGPNHGVLLGKPSGDEEGFVPFASEIGRGVALSDGFAVGAKHQIEGVMHAAVAVVDAKAETIVVHNIDKSRGDVDAPLVVRAGEGWVAAVLEPNASGMSVRLLRVKGEDLSWGAEIAQGRDESLAYDIAFGKEVGVVTWDDVAGENERGVVMAATVTVDSLEGGEQAKAVSRREVDAELPRVVPRPGGFWLAYIARARPDAEADAGAPEDPEGRYRAERIEPSWLELVPLDERGAPETQPAAVTDADGYVLAYDIEPAPDGNVLITWRDADTPSGAHGGRVTSQLVTPSGAGQSQTVTEEDVGAGIPTLLRGWVSVPGAAGEVRLAPMRPDGELVSGLRPEPLLREGQLVASKDDVVLAARPAGKAIRLITVRCTP